MNLLKLISQKTKLDKKVIVIVLAGIVGIALLILSEVLPGGENPVQEQENQQQDVLYTQYAQDIEGRLENLISSIQGAGRAQVMVTLDCSDENVYATQLKRSDTENGANYESSVVIVENGGSQEGILIKVVQPEIRGVAVVCPGGGSPQVKKSILDTVTAVLGISSARVNIATMKTDNGG